jgi:NADP-dependent 3-hydroxy acid dehydrogenase YdfG
LLATVNADDPKVALITGASSGIGYATAKHLASVGMKVVLTARRVDKLKSAVEEITAAGGIAMYTVLDVTKEEDHINAFKLAEDTYGGVDYVFINAGWEGTLAPFLEHVMSQMKNVLDINVYGMLASMKYGAIALKKRGGGAMVTCSSVAGTISADMYGAMGHSAVFGPYAVSKAATDGIGRMGKMFLTDNIRVYNIKPAVYLTQMAENFPGGAGALSGFNPFFKGRAGDPRFIGEVVEHMFTGATKWQPGQNIVCDGDATFDSALEYKYLEVIGAAASTEEVKAALRSASGGPYECTTESSCKIYNGDKQEL